MGRLKKVKSISKVFRFYIIIFILLVAAQVVGLFIFFQVGMNIGLINPANYYEQKIERNRNEIETANIDDLQNYIPENCVYFVYDSKGNIINTNRDIDFAEEIWNIISNGRTSGKGYYYKVIMRNNNEVCITGYTLNAFFNNKYMNKYFPNPEIFFALLFFVIFILNIVMISKQFGKRLSKEMKILNKTTHNITMENLDFKINYGNIEEINAVLSALDKMKKELHDSLEKQWKLENMRKSQISALAHDIKTPLAIIKGNSELLGELDLNSEQKIFNDEIQSEISTIEDYLKIIIEIMNSNKTLKVEKKIVDTDEFINDLINTAMSILSHKKLQLVKEIEELPTQINIDADLLKRSLVNIISNSVDFSPLGSKLFLSVKTYKNHIIFDIHDNGRGFTEEEIKYAKEEFFQGDKSRSNKNHYGMGLYIANKFITDHNGELILSNSEKLLGARVTIRLPIN
ncbi:MAG TPA: sensor histidine kinase [Clostridium sp.]|nr:sensor histidine kinase [Clostridium sp.]